jgi:hypothetical protein
MIYSLKEGNLYNVQDEISQSVNPSEEGLENWKKEVIKQLYKNLQYSSNTDIQNLIKNTFGNVLD